MQDESATEVNELPCPMLEIPKYHSGDRTRCTSLCQQKNQNRSGHSPSFWRMKSKLKRSSKPGKKLDGLQRMLPKTLQRMLLRILLRMLPHFELSPSVTR